MLKEVGTLFGIAVFESPSMPPNSFALVSERQKAIAGAATILGAEASDIPGLWRLPNYREVTENQLLDIASQRHPQ